MSSRLCHRLNSGQRGYSEDYILKHGARTGPKSLRMLVTSALARATVLDTQAAPRSKRQFCYD